MTVLRSFLLVAACSAFLGAQTVNNKITLACSITPSAVQTGQTSSALLVCANSNTSSTQQIQPNDTFTFQFSIGDGQISALIPSVIVNSSTLSASDFSVTLGSGALTVTYSGAAKVFAPGDSFAVEFSLIPPSKVGSGKITLQFPSSASYDSPSPGLLTLPVTDFPLAPPGPQGPPGPEPPFIPQGPPVRRADGTTGRRAQPDREGNRPNRAARCARSDSVHRSDRPGATGLQGPRHTEPGTREYKEFRASKAYRVQPDMSSTIGINQDSFTATNANVNSSGRTSTRVPRCVFHRKLRLEINGAVIARAVSSSFWAG